MYIEPFGESKDNCSLVAEVNGKVIDAVCTRIMNDYGHINNETLGFAICPAKIMAPLALIALQSNRSGFAHRSSSPEKQQKKKQSTY